MSEHRQVHFFGKLPVKVTLHTWLHEVHLMREKAMNEGNPTLITSSDKTNRKHVCFCLGVFAFLHKLNMF